MKVLCVKPAIFGHRDSEFPERTHFGLATCAILTDDFASEEMRSTKLYRSAIPGG
jgi:hypothetical protein